MKEGFIGMSEQDLHSAPPPPLLPPDPPHASEDSSESNNSNGRRTPPPPPNPSADPRLRLSSSLSTSSVPQQAAGSEEDLEKLALLEDDIFKVQPMVALRLLSAGVEALVRITGDIPPTPPPTSPTVPNMRGMQAEKESIVRSHSEKNLAKLAALAAVTVVAGAGGGGGVGGGGDGNGTGQGQQRQQHSPSLPIRGGRNTQHVDGVHLRATPQPSTPSPAPTPADTSSEEQQNCHLQRQHQPYVVIGANSQPLNTQHSAITRKFYSRSAPPISIGEYLSRLHRYCPMSTAVYLATALYIQRLAVLERAICVTARNAHRLLLAGLRVAMKALEDYSYSSGKMAKVGGVGEAELARLEISFCFLTGFELVVGERQLREQWEALRRGSERWGLGSGPAGDGSFGLGPRFGRLRLDVAPRGEGMGQQQQQQQQQPQQQEKTGEGEQ